MRSFHASGWFVLFNQRMIMGQLIFSFPVHEAMRIFVGLTSADGYDTRLSHLGPDPRVRAIVHFENEEVHSLICAPNPRRIRFT